MLEKYEKMKAGAKQNPFIDTDGYRAYVAQKEQAFQKTLKEQRDE